MRMLRGLRQISNMIVLYLVFNRNQNVFELLSRKTYGFVLKFRAAGEAYGSVSEKEEVVAEVWGISTVVNETLYYEM